MITINDIDKELIEYINGSMLGDGHIQEQKYGARYIQSFAFRYYEWAQKIQKDFHEFGIDSKLSLRNCKANSFHVKEYQQWYLQTRGNANKVIFPTLREKWYNNRIIERGSRFVELKTVPLNIDISPPQLLTNWYMGDGTYNKLAKYCVLYTQGFTHQEISMLSRKLNRVLLINTKVTKGNYILLSVEDSHVFLDYIKDYKLKCFAYKWGEPIDF